MLAPPLWAYLVLMPFIAPGREATRSFTPRDAVD